MCWKWISFSFAVRLHKLECIFLPYNAYIGLSTDKRIMWPINWVRSMTCFFQIISLASYWTCVTWKHCSFLFLTLWKREMRNNTWKVANHEGRKRWNFAFPSTFKGTLVLVWLCWEDGPSSKLFQTCYALVIFHWKWIYVHENFRWFDIVWRLVLCDFFCTTVSAGEIWVKVFFFTNFAISQVLLNET